MKFTSFIYQSLIKIYVRLPFKKYICLVFRSLPVNNEKIYRDLTFKGPFTVKLPQKKFKLIHFGSTLENEIFWKGIEGGWEKVSLSIWMKLCENSKVILDIGANKGIYSLVASALNPGATIYAFEPSKNVFERFQDNIKLNHFTNIQTFDFAISNRSGKAIFYDFESDHQYSASLNKNMITNDPSKKEVTVNVKTLDDFVEENRNLKVDLLKIDVEMHETEVLEGFKVHLRQFKPTMIIEILSDAMAARIEEQLAGLDYLYFNIDEINSPKRVDHLSKSDLYNFLICREDVAKELQLI
ncbi:MAG TPA: FkbM family methyltransferase [Chitinophagales bacterium]|nr:FkbM family methyltransferase [Chitinophagales bacterium]